MHLSFPGQRPARKSKAQVLLIAMLVPVILLLWPYQAKAVLDLYVKTAIAVYEKPNTGSNKIAQLEKGDRVVISPEIYGNFRKVLIFASGKRRPGYILTKDLGISTIRERGKERIEAEKRYHSRHAVGLFGSLSYMSQNSFNITGVNGDIYQVKNLTGSTGYGGFLFDMPLNPAWVARAYTSVRKTDMKGNVQGTTFRRQQTFYAGGLALKYYGHAATDLWFSGGIEVGQGSSSEFTVDNTTPIRLHVGRPPMYVMATAGAGLDFKLTQKLYLLPELRFGAIANQTPTMFASEAVIAASYAF